MKKLPRKVSGLIHRYDIWVKRHPEFFSWQSVFIATGTFCSALLFAYTIQFYLPRTINFSYAGANCSTNPVLLPNLVSEHPSPGFDIKLPSSVNVFGYPLYSHNTCITPIVPPNEASIEVVQLNHFGSGFLKKNIKVMPAEPPLVTNMDIFDAPLAAKSPLVIQLEDADNIYDYRVLANDKEVGCSKDDASLICEIEELGLVQSTKYDLSLQRYFNGEKVEEVFQRPVTTVEPIRVVGSSVAAGGTIFDVPSVISLTLDKEIESYSGAKLSLINGETHTELTTETSLIDKTITWTFKEPLPRAASFVLSLENATAPDGGYLLEPFSLPFQTSGGPKVVKASIGTYKVSTSGSIVLTFDSNIAADQSAAEFVKLEIGTSAVAASVTKNAKTVTIKPAAALPKCTAFTIKVLDGLKNEFGISGGSAYQLNSRTICQTVFSIGTSVQGRSITAYSFGSGPSRIIYIGTLHGNEKSATYLLNSWIDALEAGADRIPANRTIIVIPNVNPDGFAGNLRTNANNVDLNRNFASNDWKSGVTMPGGAYLENGGGTSPASEPETQAIANYISSQSPRLVITYHASGSVVSPNDAGDSQAIASVYAQKSSVGYLSNNATGSFFPYDLTGAMESWLHDKKGIPTLLIELNNKTSNEFSGHINALWFTATLP